MGDRNLAGGVEFWRLAQPDDGVKRQCVEEDRCARPLPWGGRSGGRHRPASGDRERLVRQFRPLRIVLFGSQARQDARPGSDIDLLVVLPEVQDKRRTLVAMLRALGDLPVPVDVIPTDPGEISRRGHLVGSVLRSALREGRVLYERTGS